MSTASVRPLPEGKSIGAASTGGLISSNLGHTLTGALPAHSLASNNFSLINVSSDTTRQQVHRAGELWARGKFQLGTVQVRVTRFLDRMTFCF